MALDTMCGPRFFAVTDNSNQQVSARKICIRQITWHNDDAAARFMQIFHAASADVTVGTTVPNMVFQLAADTTATFPLEDAVFDDGFTFAITTTRTGATGGSLSDVMVMIV